MMNFKSAKYSSFGNTVSTNSMLPKSEIIPSSGIFTPSLLNTPMLWKSSKSTVTGTPTLKFKESTVPPWISSIQASVILTEETKECGQ